MRILAVDPGQKRIGIAISDPSGRVAFPLTVIPHCSKQVDAGRIAALAEQHGVDLILVGQALGLDQQPTLQGRRSLNLAQAIRARTQIPVVLHDEYETTQIVLNARKEMGAKSKKRGLNIDAYAAVVLLQSYIESRSLSDHAE
ncbi:MAG: Holliday junction resolvase RuvX [Anaerolineales bacterium]|nr:Holliday junction resolvase RuvX [Anaerolineales bacterium]MCS7248544.1 Holliday junction resolvase RuvX [Anaerolineales bacterium]MDW8162357.1 Holliday junction resolvase RuvX [Anaerolineales bacterium]MDW8447984.1 Holliday junction resolvase RuvX [Anaerolineales bacterium]